jgi:hypothetical protein
LEDKQRRLEQLAEKRRRVKKELEAETVRILGSSCLKRPDN